MSERITASRIIVGYHGCDRGVAERVLLRGDDLQPSDNPYDWLGRGIYFWEHGPERAWEFARWKQRRGELAEPFVLGAYIALGDCLDLTDTAATRQLGLWFEAFRAQMERHGRPLPENRRAGAGDVDLVLRNLDCAVINSGIAGEDVAVDTVRGVFIEGPPAYSGSMIRTHSHVQLAVRNPACILGTFFPRRRS